MPNNYRQHQRSRVDPLPEDFLAQDMEKNPQHIQAISSELVGCVQSLVSGVDVDLDAPLLDEDE